MDQKGTPLRVEIGPRDVEKGSVAVARRDKPHKEKQFIANEEFIETVDRILQNIQSNLLEQATEFRDSNMKKVDSMDEFVEFLLQLIKINQKSMEDLLYVIGPVRTKRGKIAKDHKVTIRCIPHGDEFKEEGTCILTGKPSQRRVVFSKAY